MSNACFESKVSPRPGKYQVTLRWAVPPGGERAETGGESVAELRFGLHQGFLHRPRQEAHRASGIRAKRTSVRSRSEPRSSARRCGRARGRATVSARGTGVPGHAGALDVAPALSQRKASAAPVFRTASGDLGVLDGRIVV